MDIAKRDKYLPLRTRIFLRELLGREPTEYEIEDQCPIVKSQDSEPTEEQLRQIIRAYSNGNEVTIFFYSTLLSPDRTIH